MLDNWENNESIKRFREYLRIPSVHPDVDYDGCVKFLHQQAESLGLPVKVYHVVPKKPIVVLTWVGSDPSLPAILLNSHMDVVPVFEKSWTFPPFSAHLTEDGKIYARGSQDMKCVGIQYLEAIRNLKQANVVLRRTIHISFVPDEEIGGVDGMKKFVLTNDFKLLNIGFALDEGVASPNDDYLLFNGEKSMWHLLIHCKGQPGHGSILHENTAGEKINYIITKFMDMREVEKMKLKNNPSLTLGGVTSINLTGLRGGIQANVVPEVLTAIFDVRLAVTVNHEEFEKQIREWCEEAGGNIQIEFELKDPPGELTKLDESNPFWLAFKAAADQMNLTLHSSILPGATDSRFVREVGIPAISFSPMNRTPILLHDHDEYLNADVFLNGISVYEKLIHSVSNV